MAHKWLIKIQFTAYKVHQYFARVCLRRFMGELFVFCWKTGFPFQNQKSFKKIIITIKKEDLVELCLVPILKPTGNPGTIHNYSLM